jgi:hypothetical protein
VIGASRRDVSIGCSGAVISKQSFAEYVEHYNRTGPAGLRRADRLGGIIHGVPHGT